MGGLGADAMEEEVVAAGRKRRRKGSKEEKTSASRSSPSLDLSSFDRSLFPLLLAAAANAHRNSDARSIVKRFLRSHLALLSRSALTSSPPPPLPQLLPQCFLSLLPLLLSSSCPSVAALCAEVVGAAALCSLEVNMMIASDGGVVRGLVWALGSRSQRVVEAACHAIMDLSTSPIGRERLRHAFAVERLLSLFCQVSAEKKSDDCYKRVPTKEKFLALILDATVVLINTSSEDFLDGIPTELVKIFIPFLRQLWLKIRGSPSPSNCDCLPKLVGSSKHDLAATIFKLSMNQALPTTWESYEVRRSIFGSSESDFENFIMSYWEKSPLLLEASKNSEERNNILNSLTHSLNPKTINNVLDSILLGSVSCPPIASDGLDINCFLNEVEASLGSPIKYGQDVRVLKTQELISGSLSANVKKEVHFFKNNMDSVFKDINCIEKCKEAFHDGYTIALRGMEFRSEKVAGIADVIANLFGLPSIGANVYLTPSRSQGLAQHYDDHCVFIWQLSGRKQWFVSPRQTSFLPRLYEPLHNLPGLDSAICGGKQVLLEEGDILYIPRGYPHEAHTFIDECESQNKASTDFSVHLTLAIEVEPPFEWEGFAHVALHCWNNKQKNASHHLIDSELEKPRVMFVVLLHVAIRLVADHDPLFRRACMVAARHLSCGTGEKHHLQALKLSQRSTFCHIIEQINAKSSFTEAFNIIETAVREGNDDSLQWMRWLQHLPQDQDAYGKIDFNNLLEVLEDLVVLYSECKEEAMTEFIRFKSRFCRFVGYEDAYRSFVLLLEKYRKARRQYTKGMLSLHSTQ